MIHGTYSAVTKGLTTKALHPAVVVHPSPQKCYLPTQWDHLPRLEITQLHQRGAAAAARCEYNMVTPATTLAAAPKIIAAHDRINPAKHPALSQQPTIPCGVYNLKRHPLDPRAEPMSTMTGKPTQEPLKPRLATVLGTTGRGEGGPHGVPVQQILVGPVKRKRKCSRSDWQRGRWACGTHPQSCK
jgi:hypothetical protein